MKILFDHSSPFLLAHGGFQIQIEETKRALDSLGISMEFLRWWDAEQRGDIIHFFGRPSGEYIDFAHQKNMGVVMTELLTGLGSRGSRAITAQGLSIRFMKRWVPMALTAKMGWNAYHKADRIIALTAWEAELMRRVFEAPPAKVTVIPNGVANEFLCDDDSKGKRGVYLICTATITERKRILELARAAVQAKTPLWIIGRAYAETDLYAKRFSELAQKHKDLIRYEGAIQDRQQLARIYREARGFVLLSEMESLSLSALEASACDCPLLLSDLPWARTYFKNGATYCPISSVEQTAIILRKFYENAPNLQRSAKPLAWKDVGAQLKAVYQTVIELRHSRVT